MQGKFEELNWVGAHPRLERLSVWDSVEDNGKIFILIRLRISFVAHRQKERIVCVNREKEVGIPSEISVILYTP